MAAYLDEDVACFGPLDAVTVTDAGRDRDALCCYAHGPILIDWVARRPELVGVAVRVAQDATDLRREGRQPKSFAVAHHEPEERLSDGAAARVRRSVPKETRRGYAGDWKRYGVWCAATGREPLPTSPVGLAEYANTLADADRAPSTITRAMAAIVVAHRSAGIPQPDNTLARAIVRDHKRQRALVKKRVRKAAPVTVPRLRLMVDTCDLTKASGLRDRALLVLGFAIAARREELTRLDVSDLTFSEAGLEVEIRMSKTDDETHTGRTVFVPFGSNPDTCPVRTVRAWISLLQGTGQFTEPRIVHSMTRWLARHQDGLYAGPLFLRIDRHGTIGNVATGRGTKDGRLTGQVVAFIVRDAAIAAGFDPTACWSGHSLRRGFASEAYAAGALPLSIDRHGGWADGSVAKLGYIEDVDRQKNSPLIGIGL